MIMNRKLLAALEGCATLCSATTAEPFIVKLDLFKAG